MHLPRGSLAVNMLLRPNKTRVKPHSNTIPFANPIYIFTNVPNVYTESHNVYYSIRNSPSHSSAIAQRPVACNNDGKINFQNSYMLALCHAINCIAFAVIVAALRYTRGWRRVESGWQVGGFGLDGRCGAEHIYSSQFGQRAQRVCSLSKVFGSTRVRAFVWHLIISKLSIYIPVMQKRMIFIYTPYRIRTRQTQSRNGESMLRANCVSVQITCISGVRRDARCVNVRAGHLSAKGILARAVGLGIEQHNRTILHTYRFVGSKTWKSNHKLWVFRKERECDWQCWDN